MPYANNKGADQPAHSRSLISAFVFRCLVSIIPLLALYDIWRLVVSVAEQVGLSLTWSQTQKTDFLMTMLIRKQEHGIWKTLCKKWTRQNISGEQGSRYDPQKSLSRYRHCLTTATKTRMPRLLRTLSWCAPLSTFMHPPSLTRVFAVRLKENGILRYPVSALRRLWSDWVDAQDDLSLRWAHRSFCWFCHEAAHSYQSEDAKTKFVWPHFKISWYGRARKSKQEEMGRKPRLDGWRGWRKAAKERYCCNIICSARQCQCRTNEKVYRWKPSMERLALRNGNSKRRVLKCSL